ncbi:TIGR02186 family protein, partial [Pontibaca methylaminivorans]
AVGAPDTIRDAERFTEAIIRIRERANLYQQREGRVDLRQETLFSTAISMPSELVEGVYDVRIFLTRKGEVISEHDSSIDVRKVGLERWLFALAHARPFFYGLMSLAVAILAGWGASEAFRKLRNW